MGQLAAQVGDHRLEQPGIQTGIGVGQGGLAGPLDLQAIPQQRALAGVLQGSQAAEGGIEKPQQQQREQIVVMKNAVGMGAGIAQTLAVFSQNLEILGADQLLIGPFGRHGLVVLAHQPQQTRSTKQAQVGFLLMSKVAGQY